MRLCPNNVRYSVLDLKANFGGKSLNLYECEAIMQVFTLRAVIPYETDG